RQFADDALGVRAFLDAFDIGRLHLVAERLLDFFAGVVVLVGPAEIGDRADIDEAGLEGVGRAEDPRTADRRGGDRSTHQLGEGSSALQHAVSPCRSRESSPLPVVSTCALCKTTPCIKKSPWFYKGVGESLWDLFRSGIVSRRRRKACRGRPGR